MLFSIVMFHFALNSYKNNSQRNYVVMSIHRNSESNLIRFHVHFLSQSFKHDTNLFSIFFFFTKDIFQNNIVNYF